MKEVRFKKTPHTDDKVKVYLDNGNFAYGLVDSIDEIVTKRNVKDKDGKLIIKKGIVQQEKYLQEVLTLEKTKNILVEDCDFCLPEHKVRFN